MRINKEAEYGQYDILGIAKIVGMAMRDSLSEETGENFPGKKIPDGTFSDLDCLFWSEIEKAIQFGIAIGTGNKDRIKDYMMQYRNA